MSLPDRALSVASVQARLASELALPSRVRYVALLLVSIAMASIVGALLVTESALPMRTRVALAVMLVVALCWIGFSCWVLSRRRVLYLRHRMVAGRMAVGFSVLFSLVCVLLGGLKQGGDWWVAGAGCGGAMLITALALLVRSSRAVSALAARRIALENALVSASGSAGVR